MKKGLMAIPYLHIVPRTLSIVPRTLAIVSPHSDAGLASTVCRVC